MTKNNTPEYIRIDERNHVEKPVLDLDTKQKASDTYRQSFAKVIRI